MGASNFHKANASKYFVIQTNNNLEFDLDFDYIQSELNLSDTKHKDEHELKSYPSKVLGEKSITNSFDNNSVNVSVYVYLIYRSGYYEHGCIDWTVESFINGNPIFSDDDISDEIRQVIGYDNVGRVLTTELISHILEQMQQSLIKEVEDKLESITISFHNFATFSNGETIYTKA